MLIHLVFLLFAALCDPCPFLFPCHSSYKEFKNLATELCEYAVRCGSKDNVSCIIILIDFPKPDRKTVKAAKKAEKAAAANNGDRGPK